MDPTSQTKPAPEKRGAGAAPVATTMAAPLLCCLLFASTGLQARSHKPDAGAGADAAEAAAQQPTCSSQGPTLVLETGLGPLPIQLHTDAAPGAVARLVELATEPLFPHGPSAGTSDDPAEQRRLTYFDLLEFGDVRPGRQVTLSWLDDPAFEVGVELSAGPVGLHERRVENAGEAMDLFQFELLPTWRGQGERSTVELAGWIERFLEDHDPSFLVGTSHAQILAAEGLPLRPGLATRPVRRGSVVLVPSGDPSRSRLQLRFVLVDRPKLDGRRMVVGSLTDDATRLVERIAAAPRLIDLTQRKRDRYRPVDPVEVTGSRVACR